MIFFWLNDVNLAIERVKIRVTEGGHDIPEDVIIRRYKKGLTNLVDIFVNLCDYWLVIDNSSEPYSFIAEGNGYTETNIYHKEKWEEIKKCKK